MITMLRRLGLGDPAAIAMLKEAIERAHGHQGNAARALGITPTTLGGWIAMSPELQRARDTARPSRRMPPARPRSSMGSRACLSRLSQVAGRLPASQWPRAVEAAVAAHGGLSATVATRDRSIGTDPTAPGFENMLANRVLPGWGTIALLAALGCSKSAAPRETSDTASASPPPDVARTLDASKVDKTSANATRRPVSLTINGQTRALSSPLFYELPVATWTVPQLIFFEDAGVSCDDWKQHEGNRFKAALTESADMLLEDEGTSDSRAFAIGGPYDIPNWFYEAQQPGLARGGNRHGSVTIVALTRTTVTGSITLSTKDLKLEGNFIAARCHEPK